MAEVLQHFTVLEKLRLASVCRLWRACVANSWKYIQLDLGHTHKELGEQLVWLSHCVPSHVPKVSTSVTFGICKHAMTWWPCRA